MMPTALHGHLAALWFFGSLARPFCSSSLSLAIKILSLCNCCCILRPCVFTACALYDVCVCIRFEMLCGSLRRRYSTAYLAVASSQKSVASCLFPVMSAKFDFDFKFKVLCWILFNQTQLCTALQNNVSKC